MSALIQNYLKVRSKINISIWRKYSPESERIIIEDNVLSYQSANLKKYYKSPDFRATHTYILLQIMYQNIFYLSNSNSFYRIIISILKAVTIKTFLF